LFSNFNCCFEDTDISQGSVATHLRCSEIFRESIITNVLLILRVKQVRKSVNIDEVKAYEVKAYKKVCQFY